MELENLKFYQISKPDIRLIAREYLSSFSNFSLQCEVPSFLYKQFSYFRCCYNDCKDDICKDLKIVDKNKISESDISSFLSYVSMYVKFEYNDDKHRYVNEEEVKAIYENLSDSTRYFIEDFLRLIEYNIEIAFFKFRYSPYMLKSLDLEEFLKQNFITKKFEKYLKIIEIKLRIRDILLFLFCFVFLPCVCAWIGILLEEIVG